mgnify:CR=1 FL=1
MPSVETDIYRLNSHPLQDPSTLRGGLAIHKKIAGKCRRPFSDPPGDLIDRWEHRDGRGRAPRANGSDIPFSAIPPDLRRGKGVNIVLFKILNVVNVNCYVLLPALTVILL